MSKGPGAIERRIADLFAATRDRALSIDDVTAAAFRLRGKTPTRAQRLSATRAAHRLLRRVREANALHSDIVGQAHDAAGAKLGSESHDDYWREVEGHPRWAEGEQLWKFVERIGVWSNRERHTSPHIGARCALRAHRDGELSCVGVSLSTLSPLHWRPMPAAIPTTTGIRCGTSPIGAASFHLTHGKRSCGPLFQRIDRVVLAMIALGSDYLPQTEFVPYVAGCHGYFVPLLLARYVCACC
jgi:hypothetical protein